MSPLKVVPIASKSDNSASWSPEQALLDLLAEIRSGETVPAKLIVLCWTETEDKHLHPCRWFAGGVSHAEEIALLEISKQQAIADWED